MRRLVSTVTSAKNDELISIMKLYAERCKIVSEPTGCLGLVGIQHLVRKGVIKPGDRVGCLITGGNVDMLRYTQLITGPSADPVIEKTTQILEVNTQQTKTSDNASLQSNDQEDFSGSDEGSHPIFDELSSPVVNKFQVKDEIEEDEGRRSACHDFFSLRKILARFVSL